MPQEPIRTLDVQVTKVRGMTIFLTYLFLPVSKIFVASIMRTARPMACTVRMALPICVIYVHITGSGIGVVVER